MLQILFALLAGILTIGAPCILPVLPILLGTTIGHQSKTRPFFITLGFIISFTGLALLFSVFTNILGLSSQTLRYIAIAMLIIFGVFLVWPLFFEKLTLRLSGLINRANKFGQSSGNGNLGGFVLGMMLGVIWTPCAGPVLGTILALIATKNNLVEAAILLFAYAIGAGIPLLIIAYGGQYVTTRVRSIAKYTPYVQKVFGVLIIVLAIAMYFNYDTLLQAKLLEYIPVIY